MGSSHQQKPLVILDELNYYFGDRNESLKRDLRHIEGIPNTTYLVKGRQVFVFDKLVELVNEQLSCRPNEPLADLARSLLAEANVSAKDAVEIWGIVPEPYEMAENPFSGLMIRHRPFNARLPGYLENISDVQEVFARILLGDIQPGEGEFVYRGQPMTLCDHLDTALLPPRPVVQRAEQPESLGYTALHNITYESGFSPVSRALFDEVKAQETSWNIDRSHAFRVAQLNAADCWEKVESFRLEALDNKSDEVPEYGQEDFIALRQLYPELSMLSDGALYYWFDDYQSECCYIRWWTANRDDDFLFYLIGKVAGLHHENNTGKDVGQWIFYALLQGDSLPSALAFGRAAALYDSAIFSLARRIADAMQFLAEDKNTTERHGRAVTTMMDLFRRGRKFGGSMIVNQSMQDF